jgi:hypothetical protein
MNLAIISMVSLVLTLGLIQSSYAVFEADPQATGQNTHLSQGADPLNL